MPLTTEQRIELLKKAREAKAKKKEERDAEKPTPVKGRPKKETKKTLDITETFSHSKGIEPVEIQDEEMEEIMQETEEVIDKIRNISSSSKRTSKKLQSQIEPEPEPEIVEEVEVRKIKKPKRRIVRKIIKEQYDSESTEEEIEEVIYKPPKYKSKARVKEVEKPPELPEPREPAIRQSKPTLNIFGY